jgi:hypothetical protein
MVLCQLVNNSHYLVFAGCAAEFLAHEGAVNCVRIGRSTAGVLATGGEDKKVNLWRTGHTEVVKVR